MSNIEKITELENQAKYERFQEIRKKYEFRKPPFLALGCGVQFLNKDLRVLSGIIIEESESEFDGKFYKMVEIASSDRKGKVESLRMSKNRLMHNLLDYKSGKNALKVINKINSENDGFGFQAQPEYQ